VALDLPEIQSLDLLEVLHHKGEAARREVGGPVVVEETGLELPALGGFPGPLVKWMLQAIGPDGIARVALAEGDTTATARCALLYLDGEREVVAQGTTTGDLVLPGRGDHGFGWDPVFQPQGSERTYGEMTAEEKDVISHRGSAWRSFLHRLTEAGLTI
jgi:non-canonical purine NTP pyrophosphatase (RdgB/HAM1 family)